MPPSEICVLEIGPIDNRMNETAAIFSDDNSQGKKLTSASRWRADALLQCRCSDIGAMHRNATGQCGLVILPWVANKMNAHESNKCVKMFIQGVPVGFDRGVNCTCT